MISKNRLQFAAKVSSLFNTKGVGREAKTSQIKSKESKSSEYKLRPGKPIRISAQVSRTLVRASQTKPSDWELTPFSVTKPGRRVSVRIPSPDALRVHARSSSCCVSSGSERHAGIPWMYSRSLPLFILGVFLLSVLIVIRVGILCIVLLLLSK